MGQTFETSLRGRRVAVSGALDLATAPELEQLLRDLSSVPGDVVIDAAGLSFVDSSGIRTILSLARTLEGRGRVRIVNAGEQVLRVLDLVRADALIDIGGESA